MFDFASNIAKLTKRACPASCFPIGNMCVGIQYWHQGKFLYIFNLEKSRRNITLWEPQYSICWIINVWSAWDPAARFQQQGLCCLSSPLRTVYIMYRNPLFLMFNGWKVVSSQWPWLDFCVCADRSGARVWRYVPAALHIKGQGRW